MKLFKWQPSFVCTLEKLSFFLFNDKRSSENLKHGFQTTFLF
ncbi:hypothetical protein HMPREF3156_00500 [Neisseria sp. HMSC06F02]|nr:hypothetical protein HMPREF3156_00500 [Neisseria sp. HMSC06F02]